MTRPSLLTNDIHGIASLDGHAARCLTFKNAFGVALLEASRLCLEVAHQVREVVAIHILCVTVGRAIAFVME